MKLSFSSCAQREKFEEVAALAAIGEAGALELEHLRQHLRGCSSCSAAFEAFTNLASNDLGLAAANRELDSDSDKTASSDDSEGHRLLERVRRRLVEVPNATGQPLKPLAFSVRERTHTGRFKYRRIAYGVAAMLLLSLSVAGGISAWRTRRALSLERARASRLEAAADSLRQQKGEKPSVDSAVLRSLKESQQTRDVLQKSLSAAEAKNQDLV